MNMYYTVVEKLVVLVLYASVIGLIYSLISKKPKLPWVFAFAGAFAMLSFLVVFEDRIKDRMDPPKETAAEKVDTSGDLEGTIRVDEGKYIVGEGEIPKGGYDMSFVTSGNLNVLATDTLRDFDDYKAFNNIEKSRLYLNDGDGISLAGDAIFVPIVPEKMSYEEVEIYSGLWPVGINLAPGKYITKDVKGGGNMNVTKPDGSSGFRSILEDGQEMELFEGDLVEIKSTILKLSPVD